MKYLFYLLLVCNVVVYLWGIRGGREQSSVERHEISLPPESESIALIKELPAIPKKAPEPTPQVKETPPLSEPVPAPTASPPDEKEAAAEAQDSLAVAPSPPEDGCFLVGPYHSESAARRALDRLKPQIEQAQVVSRYGDVEDGYWVLYPKAENLEVGRANRKMLMDRGVRDLWLFDKGELQGAISLGIYKTKERAEGLQQKFREQGLDVEVRPRLTRAKAPWVEVRWQGERSELDAIVARLGSEHPERQENRLRPCR